MGSVHLAAADALSKRELSGVCGRTAHMHPLQTLSHDL
jgi:hypothetical protein